MFGNEYIGCSVLSWSHGHLVVRLAAIMLVTETSKKQLWYQTLFHALERLKNQNLSGAFYCALSFLLWSNYRAIGPHDGILIWYARLAHCVFLFYDFWTDFRAKKRPNAKTSLFRSNMYRYLKMSHIVPPLRYIHQKLFLPIRPRPRIEDGIRNQKVN